MQTLRTSTPIIIIISLLMIACETNVEPIPSKPRQTWERRTIKASENENLTSILNDLRKGPQAGRIESQFGTLDTNEVSMIRFDNLERYGLLIENDDWFHLTNLIIQNINGEVSARIIRHIPDSSWLANQYEKIL